MFGLLHRKTGLKKHSGLLTALATILLGPTPDARAQDNARFIKRCGEWVAKKGYSVDYIEQRTGERPSGNMAQNWRSNLDPKDAAPGDVVFIGVDGGDGKGQRAEVVEEVSRDVDGSIKSFRTSSMNIGKSVEAECHVTENFGKVTTRRVAFDRVIRAWRPGTK